MAAFEPIRGVIFDLDGTLVDSGLDFDEMRREMELEPGLPLLEALATLSEPRAKHCRAILERHERAGAERARLMPGVAEMLAALHDRGILRAVFTRNAREITLATLDRLKLDFETIVGREDAPPKPDPAGIWRICEAWNLSRRQVAMVGDYAFDIEAGRRAGVWTVLVHADSNRPATADFPPADLDLAGFEQAEPWLAWLAEPT
jgi:HAD superfamily hydrolase (TIGR01509 family)